MTVTAVWGCGGAGGGPSRGRRDFSTDEELLLFYFMVICLFISEVGGRSILLKSHN